MHRPRAQKRVTLEEAYGSSSEEEAAAIAACRAADAEDGASSASEVDALQEVPDSDCSSDASLASEAESASPPAKKRKVCPSDSPWLHQAKTSQSWSHIMSRLNVLSSCPAFCHAAS